MSKSVSLIINGRSVQVSDGIYSYESIVDLAGKTGEPTITHRWPCPPYIAAGELLPGEQIKVRGGMIISVQHTGDS